MHKSPVDGEVTGQCHSGEQPRSSGSRRSAGYLLMVIQWLASSFGGGFYICKTAQETCIRYCSERSSSALQHPFNTSAPFPMQLLPSFSSHSTERLSPFPAKHRVSDMTAGPWLPLGQVRTLRPGSSGQGRGCTQRAVLQPLCLSRAVGRGSRSSRGLGRAPDVRGNRFYKLPPCRFTQRLAELVPGVKLGPDQGGSGSC